MTSQSQYIFGKGSELEYQRLVQQGAALEPFTRGAFAMAGILPGMRVLDLGCGVGDVARVLADMVGDAGQVVAVDADAGALEFGRRWLSQPNIEFMQSTVEGYEAPHSFDAVVGRAILMHVTNPVAVVRRAASALRNGGIVCFIEPWLETALSHPRVEAYQQFMDGAHNALRACGLHLNMGARLYSDFIAAGLPAPQVYGFADLGAGANASVFDRMLEGARSGIRAQVPEAQRESVLAQIEALGKAMREEAAAKNATVLEKIMVSAWVTKP